MKKKLRKEAREILKLPAFRTPVPDFMPNQKKLIEWARKTANLIVENKLSFIDKATGKGK